MYNHMSITKDLWVLEVLAQWARSGLQCPHLRRRRGTYASGLSVQALSLPHLPLPYAISMHLASPSLGVEVEVIFKSSCCAPSALTGGKTRALGRVGSF